MKRSRGRILTTHVGSLPRPRELAGMLANQYYPAREDYLRALNDAMREEYHVISSTDCGFGTFIYLTVDEKMAYARLRTLSEGAALASKELF